MQRQAISSNEKVRLSEKECGHLRDVYALSSRQMDVLRCLVERGASDKEIGKVLSMKRGTLRHHMRLLRAAFGVATRLQLLQRALVVLRDLDTASSNARQKNTASSDGTLCI